MKAKARIAAASGKNRKGRRRPDPAFGMWKDRADMKNVPAYLRRLRGERFDHPWH